jgi:hypothetical protein
MNRFFGFNKHKNKARFVERGLYFVKVGEYKGAFILNIKELDSEVAKAFLIMPDMTPTTLPKSEIKTLFSQNQLEYVETIPKDVYLVCLEQFKKSKTACLLRKTAK